MPDQPPIFYVRDDRQSKWIEELRDLILADPCLAAHEPLLDGMYLYSLSSLPPFGRTGALRDWVDGQRHMAGLVDEATGKFSIVSFQVLDWRRNAYSAFFDEVVVEIDLYAQVSHLDGEPFSIHVISPTKDEPVRYQSVFVFRGNRTLDASNIQIGDLTERFPRQVENILEKTAFIADVILSEEPR